MNKINFCRTAYLTVLCAAALSGCTSIGAVAPTSTDEKIAYAYGTVTAVRQSCTQALTTGVLPTSGAQQCLTVTDGARTALDAAKVAEGAGDDTTALGKLALATSLLTQIQQYLTAQGIK